MKTLSPPRPHLRPLIASLHLLGLVMLLGALAHHPAHANEPAAHGTAHSSAPADHRESPVASESAPAKPPKEKVPAARRPIRAPKPAAEETPASGAAAASDDPIDHLRDRLTEKLGATRANETASPGTLKLSARAEAVKTAKPKTKAAHGAAATDGHGSAPAAHTDGKASDAHGGAPHWSYDGDTGPSAWGRLQPEFAKCSTGTRQSPIDIRDGIRVELDPVQFDYKPSAFRVVDNGHTIQVNVGPGNSIQVMGKRFDLLQFHFHRPSEERVNGRQYDMVAHLVHKDVDGRLGVVAVLLDRGAAQPLIQTVWNNLPLEKGDEVAGAGQIDLNLLLPDDRRYFTYMGSLTTPPCSEGVLWMVMKQPVTISVEQVNIFARLYPMNARPIQSAASRLIKESK